MGLWHMRYMLNMVMTCVGIGDRLVEGFMNVEINKAVVMLIDGKK